MKKFLFLFLFAFTLYGQIFDAPSGYTTPFGGNYGLRLYDYDDNPSADSLNANFIDISEGFVKRAFEFQVNQIRTTNGTLLVSSSASLDTVLSSALLRFQDVTGRGEVPFTTGDVIFAQVVAQTGAGYDANGNIIDSDALIRRAVYEVDSVGSSNGLLVYVSTHSDAKVPSNKGTMLNGDVFVKIANISSGVDLIEIASDLANSPRITLFKGLNNWSEYVSDTSKKVIIGNIGNLVTNNFGTVASGTIGAYFNGGASGGNIILDNVDVKLSNQSSIAISGFNNDAGFITGADAVETYYQSSAPSSPETGDFWFDTTTPSSYIMKRYNGSTWDNVSVYMDGSGIYTSTLTAGQITSGTIGIARIPVSSIQTSQLNNDAALIKTFYQTTSPTANATGDIWVDTDDLNTMYRWNGSSWVEIIGVGTGLGTYIDASGIYTGTLTASQINAVNINAVNISGGSISGTTITGGTLQTATSGQRVVVSGSSNTLNFYSATGSAGLIYGDGSYMYMFSEDDLLLQSNLGSNYIFLNGSGATVITGSGISLLGNTGITGDLSVTGSYGLSPTDIPDISGTYAVASHTHAATAIADGSVTSAEFQYINTLTSNAQTQINGKQATLSYTSALLAGATPTGGNNTDVVYDDDTNYIWMKIDGTWRRIQ